MPQTTLDYAPRPDFDTGCFVARYLQVLAWLSIVSMVVDPFLFDEFHLDFTFIFMFLAADCLKRRSRAARRWVIGFAALYLLGTIAATIAAVVSGTSGMTIHIGRQIDDPALWQVLLVATIVASAAAVPLIVLLSARAREQFRIGFAAGFCRTCAYNLTGNVSGTCPECGTAVPAKLAAEASA